MRKHAYEHFDKVDKFKCADCNKAFPFESQLHTHRKVHLSALEHHCICCKKSFKSKGELLKHQNVHSGKTWICQKDGCDYSCQDPRNLCAHMFSHGDKTRYMCGTCNVGFNHYMQLKCHRAKNCKK